MKFVHHYFILFLCSIAPADLLSQPPRLIITFVIDQLSCSNFMKLSPYFTGGFKRLLENGVVFRNATWPHSLPSTGPGHTGLVTGTIPSVHGIIGNDWPDQNGNKVMCDGDTPENAAVFSPDGFYDFGKSTRNTMADTVGDQAMIASTAERPFAVYSISGKSRSGTAMAGKLGKAIWFDDNSGQYTSSKAFFDELPTWLTSYNDQIKKKITAYTWQPYFITSHKAYSCTNPNSNKYARAEEILNVPMELNEENPKEFYHLIERTPLYHDLILGCATECLDHCLKQDPVPTIILWIGLSGTDKIGHLFGNSSKEYCDILYHLDAQLDRFMREVGTRINPVDTLFLLTSDHGSMPIVELLTEKKFNLAKRINTVDLTNTLNKTVEEKIGIQNLITLVDTPNIYFDQKIWNSLDQKKQSTALKLLKKTIRKTPGIKQVWTYKELEKAYFHLWDKGQLYKNQLFPGRSGQLIFQVYPYVYASKYTTGAGHKTPYEYDIHVPLIFYQPNIISDKRVDKPVLVPQVAPTITSILQIPRPSAALFGELPGISH